MDIGDDLYKEIILDNYKSKRNRHAIPDADFSQEGVNPSCGDDVELFLKTDGQIVTDVSYEGMGCSICLASANMLCDSIKGRPIGEARALIAKVKALVTGDEPPQLPDYAGDLEAIGGVRNFPVRIKCALLSWSTLEQVLNEAESK